MVFVGLFLVWGCWLCFGEWFCVWVWVGWGVLWGRLLCVVLMVVWGWVLWSGCREGW